jgi:IS5 family transposase
MQLRDTLGTLYDDALFADLFPQRGQVAQAPWQLAVVTLLQFAENLSDRQAADAVRSRIDWKYLLGLELTDAGFDFSVLSEFRQRLVAARFSRKRTTTWVGYKVHLSETCEADHPHLVTQVATTVSIEADSTTLPQIQQGLADKSLLPSQQLVDTA